jgi:uncharacterized SAM-dependent methyltransferase
MYNAVELSSCASEVFFHQVIAGLSQPQKAISSRWLYDDRGSTLFEEITQLEEYYPRRTELGILAVHGRDIANGVPSAQTFRESAHALIVGDFTGPIQMPSWVPAEPRVAFFSLIGVDMKKPLSILIPAYDDERGVTAQFNLNLLRRMNRELDANFALEAFAHHVRWNNHESAIEMHLQSRRRQTVIIGRESFSFEPGETIHTESSRKYDRAAFERLAQESGWRLSRHWSDPQALFSVFGLQAV